MNEIFTFLLLLLLSGTAQVLPKSSRVTAQVLPTLTRMTSQVLPKSSRVTYAPRRTRRRRRKFSSKRRKPFGTFSSNGRSPPIGLVLDVFPSIYRYVTVF